LGSERPPFGFRLFGRRYCGFTHGGLPGLENLAAEPMRHRRGQPTGWKRLPTALRDTSFGLTGTVPLIYGWNVNTSTGVREKAAMRNGFMT
jgi:hypothetical protein